MLYSNYLLSFVEGIMTFVSPCILPMLPIYFFYLAGAADEDSAEHKLKKSTLIVNSIGFVAGFTIVFVLFGATATSLGAFLKSHRDVLKIISGVVVFIFGLNFIGLIKLSILNKEKRFDYKFKRLNFIKSIVFGIVFAFGWTPCVSAFLASLFAMASNSKTLMEGMLLLFVYSIGLGIPFIISAIVFENIKGAFRVIQKHSRIISIISGILLMAAGAALVFNFI
ncbi:cytochrome c biogenesis CcdA family protein [Acetivibrio cellulolyticus]|uniref:cytochrome c biogenesis CcdA family protein n=1 Tax=Acetivibrio cellulolyticus TaxID=35830 RepID=UPI0001E2E270|nr:cytochrome c biogenesis protein CcdA [Acetivibrio cellulolyticus]